MNSEIKYRVTRLQDGRIYGVPTGGGAEQLLSEADLTPRQRQVMAEAAQDVIRAEKAARKAGQ